MDVSSLFSVKDKVVLVTGGGSGIGLMIAEAFVKGGARVYIASRKKDVVEKSAQYLTNMGPGTCGAFSVSLDTQANCQSLISQLAQKESRLDVLVNNAGANWGAPLEEFPDAAFDKLFALNVKAVFHLTVAALPLLRKAASKSQENPAKVITIGSIDGLPSLADCARLMCQAAVHHLSRHLATRLGKDHITVNTVACGPFQSHMMKATLNKFGDRIASAAIMNRIGSPEDVGGACLWLASKAGNYVTGATIPLDGGTLINAKL